MTKIMCNICGKEIVDEDATNNSFQYMGATVRFDLNNPAHDLHVCRDCHVASATAVLNLWEGMNQ